MTTGFRSCFAAIFAFAMAFPAGLAQANDPAPVFAQDDPARIWIEDDKIHFFGSISYASRNAFMEFVRGEDTSKIRTFVVNSLGGDTRSGRVIGQWIHQNRLDVEVDAICFSSCANYIFPAGAAKTIRRASFVGWHGSETQYDIIAQSTPGKTGEDLERTSLRAALIPALPKDASNDIIDRAVDQQITLAAKSRENEAEFFKSIGVSGEFTVHGLRPGNLERWRKSGHAGWTYSLEDMQRLGLGTIVFLGDIYATSRQVVRNVYVVSYDPGLTTE